MTHPRRYLGAVAVVLWLFAACTAEFGIEADAAAPDCEVDGDCPDGFTCQFGICAEEQAKQLTIGLLIQPPAFRSNLSALHVTEMAVTLGEPLPDYALRPPVSVNGFVLFSAVAPAIGEPVSAELRFVNTQGIPGDEFEASVRTDPTTGGYAIELPPGVYTASVRPDREDVSRTNVFGIEIRRPVTNDEEHSEFRPFNLPAPEQYVRVAGRVERDALPVEGVAEARVFALTTDGRFETTVDVTGDDGYFIVFAPPSDTEYVFHVRPDGDDGDVPTAVYEPVSIPPDALSFDLSLRTGTWAEPVSVPFRVESSDGDPIPDAVVIARTALEPSTGVVDGEPGIVDGHYEVRVDSAAIAEDGTFELAVAPGRSTVYAASLDAEHGLAAPVLLAVDTTLEPVEPVRLVVEQRHPVSGSVVTSAGTPVAEVDLALELVSTSTRPLDRYGVPSQLFGASGRTDEDGRFQVAAQPGQYRATAVPPEQLGHARTTVDLEVGRGMVEGFTVELPDAGVVSGRVLDDLNEPLAGATVQAFAVDGSSATLIGLSVADADGTYRVVLPAPD